MLRHNSAAVLLMVGLCTGALADEPTADAVGAAAGIDTGLALVVADDAGLACDLADDGKLLVHVLASRSELIPALRDAVAARGLTPKEKERRNETSRATRLRFHFARRM